MAILFSVLFASCSQEKVDMDTLHPSADDKDLNLSALQFTEGQRQKLNDALAIAQQALTDTLFDQLLTARDAAGSFSWDNDRIEEVKGVQNNAYTAHFLSEFRQKGLPAISNFVAKDGYSDDDVTGSTLACSNSINFNVDNLDRSSRTPTAVAGTIVHERIHSFCLKHKSNDGTDQENLCDFAYHAGHIAIVIARYRANGSKPIAKPLKNMCEGLVEHLQNVKIIKK
jgi:hypothetical protein